MSKKRIRQILAVFFFFGITLLFLDFTGVVSNYLDWMPRLQFLPALLAMNFFVIIFLLLLTFLFGRVYCSVICPLGVLQDIISHIVGKYKKNRFFFSPAKTFLRYFIFFVFLVATLFGVGVITQLLDPYSFFGRIAGQLFQPIYLGLNNLLAIFAEWTNSYLFYSVPIVLTSLTMLIVAIGSFFIVGYLSARSGRTYCNTICPVGTFLGFFSKFSLFKPIINTEKCNGCHLCSRNCKASCIDSTNQKIDYSRCVACFSCIDNCKKGAIEYRFVFDTNKKSVEQNAEKKQENQMRRSFLTMIGLGTATVAFSQKSVDGGLAEILDREIPQRKQPIVPCGAYSLDRFSKKCTACGLCVSTCPTKVLRPSSSLDHFMQPELQFTEGYCRPECTRCAEICPTGAIEKITSAEKSSIKIGTARIVSSNCLAATEHVKCDNCARHCPNGAITMVPSSEEGVFVPSINAERCIGCGACEALCPSRPFSAIVVDGLTVHREI